METTNKKFLLNFPISIYQLLYYENNFYVNLKSNN